MLNIIYGLIALLFFGGTFLAAVMLSLIQTPAWIAGWVVLLLAWLVGRVFR